MQGCSTQASSVRAPASWAKSPTESRRHEYRIPFDPSQRDGCKAAAAFSRSMDPHLAQGFESCMNDEETAQTRLLEGWATYPADAKMHCLDQTMHNEDQSYVDVLECLHLALGIEPPKPPLHGATKKPVSGEQADQ